MYFLIYDNEPEGMPPLFFPHRSHTVDSLRFIWENPRFIMFEVTEAEGMELIGKELVWF